jgi:hypothetical protein
LRNESIHIPKSFAEDNSKITFPAKKKENSQVFVLSFDEFQKAVAWSYRYCLEDYYDSTMQQHSIDLQ